MKFNLFIDDEFKNYLLQNHDFSCGKPYPCSVHIFLNELVKIFENKTLKTGLRGGRCFKRTIRK